MPTADGLLYCALVQKRPLTPRLVCCAVATIGVAAGMGGCQKQLFPESAPRTQFERYDALRGGAAPAEEPDVFGRPQPALRARLAPKTTS